jgi:hypothetical protein
MTEREIYFSDTPNRRPQLSLQKISVKLAHNMPYISQAQNVNRNQTPPSAPPATTKNGLHATTEITIA